MIRLTGSIKGVVPLLMNNAQMADVTNPLTKAFTEVSRRKKKTDADHEEIKRLQFLGAIYTDDTGKVAIPSVNVKACWRDAAHQTEKNSKKMFIASVIPMTPFFAIKYEGPRDPEKLFATGKNVDTRLVRHQNARVLCTRAIFYAWEVEFSFLLDDALMDPSLVRRIAENAGIRVGLGDYKPEYGRFEVASWKTEKS